MEDNKGKLLEMCGTRFCIPIKLNKNTIIGGKKPRAEEVTKVGLKSRENDKRGIGVMAEARRGWPIKAVCCVDSSFLNMRNQLTEQQNEKKKIKIETAAQIIWVRSRGLHVVFLSVTTDNI
ncbi:conserved hypothetical protein [Ricinus communis]|uniref:Uncharacterized protein n=1 Tax=Ricinus communis TaxID=3988 RepID=B9RIV5_RICCO|nr:conserved hypothetical protein [Ricinus communis]